MERLPITGGLGQWVPAPSTSSSQHALPVCCALRGKETPLTDTTLAHVLRHRPEAGPAVTAAARLVVRWDRETGWGHLAIAAPGVDRLRFAGFHQFASGGTETVLAELADAGCVIASLPRVDDGDLLEIDALIACREVASDAAR